MGDVVIQWQNDLNSVTKCKARVIGNSEEEKTDDGGREG